MKACLLYYVCIHDVYFCFMRKLFILFLPFNQTHISIYNYTFQCTPIYKLPLYSHAKLYKKSTTNLQYRDFISFWLINDWGWAELRLHCTTLLPSAHPPQIFQNHQKKSITITHNNWNSPRVFIYWTCCSNKTYMYFFVCVKFTKNGEGDFWIQWMFFWKLENWYIILSLYRHIFSNLTMNSPCTDNRIFTRSTDLILDNCQMIMMKTSSFLEWRMYILFAHARMTARRN